MLLRWELELIGCCLFNAWLNADQSLEVLEEVRPLKV